MLAEHADPKQRHYLELYKMGPGPLYAFWIPYHLVHFEVPNAIARVRLFRDGLAEPLGGPVVEVCAVAKRPLQRGETLDEYGHYMTYGEAVNSAEMRERVYLPEGLVEGCVLRRTSRRTRSSATTTSNSRRAGWPTSCERAVPALLRVEPDLSAVPRSAVPNDAPSPHDGPPVTDDRPLLTICTPTFERPDLLRRALGSVVAQVDPRMTQVELVVADNSESDESEDVAKALLASWPGPTRYVRNRPSLGMVGNHNRCIELAAGRNIAFLHDDDAFVPGGIGHVLDTVSRADAYEVHLFGVDVVRIDGRVRRRQRPRRDERLSPRTALHRLLTDSSYVRLPGLVASAAAYRDAGPFAEDAANAIDLDMWVRLFARHGLHTVPTSWPRTPSTTRR